MDEFKNAPVPEEPGPQGPTAKQTFSRLGWSYLVIFGTAIGVWILLAKLASLYAPQLLNADWAVYALSFIPIYLAGLPLGWLILKRLPAEKPEDHRLDAGHFLLLFLMCFPLMYIGNIIGLGVNSGIASARGAIYENPVYELLQGSNIWANLVCVVCLAPVMEEFMFRKLLCDRIRAYGEGTAILVSGLIFGLSHGNLSQFFYAFGIGCLFAYVYLRTGRVRYTMGMHAGVNFFGGVLPLVLLKNVDLEEIAKLSSDAPEQVLRYVEGHLSEMLGLGIYVLLAFSFFIVGLVLLLSRRKQAILLPAEKQLPKKGRFCTVFLNPGMLCYFAGAVCKMVFALIS